MRIVVVVPVACIYDTGPASSVSQDQAIAAVSSWLALPTVQTNTGVVAAAALPPKAYDAGQISNAQIAVGGVIKEILP